MSWSSHILFAAQALVIWRLLAPIAGSDRWLRAALTWCLWCVAASAGVYLSHRLAGVVASWVPPLALLLLSSLWLPLARARDAALPFDQPGPLPAGGCHARLLGWAVAVALLLATAGAALHLIHHPHGWYDAWFQWNPKAALLAEPPLGWELTRAALLDQFNPDYPLLLPGVVSIGVDLCGQRSLAPPIVVACLFVASTVLLVGRGLRATSGWQFGAVGVLCLLASKRFVGIGFDQIADVPIACMVLAAVTVLGRDPGDLYRASLSGVLLGAAAWTKNEGLVIGLMVGLAGLCILPRVHGRASVRILLAMGLGALPCLLLASMQKMSFPAGDHVAGWASGTTAHLLDVERWQVVLVRLARTLFDWGYGLVLWLPLLAWWWRGRSGRVGEIPRWWWLALLLTLMAHVFVLVTSPFGVERTLNISLDRILAQLWPTYLFVTLCGFTRESQDP